MSGEVEEQATSSRRAFLRYGITKAAWAVPVVLTLNTQESFGVGSMPYYPLGSPCNSDADCCTDLRCESNS